MDQNTLKHQEDGEMQMSKYVVFSQRNNEEYSSYKSGGTSSTQEHKRHERTLEETLKTESKGQTLAITEEIQADATKECKQN